MPLFDFPPSLLYVQIISLIQRFSFLHSAGASLTKTRFPWDFPTSFWFARAAVAKYNRLGGLKQQKFIISQFWRLEV